MSILSCDKYFILSLARCEGSPFSCEKHLPYEMRKGSKWIPSPVRSIPKDTLIIHLIGQILTHILWMRRIVESQQSKNLWSRIVFVKFFLRDLLALGGLASLTTFATGRLCGLWRALRTG